MRASLKLGEFVRQLSTEVSTQDHTLVKQHAKAKQMTIHDLLQSWIRPNIAKIRAESHAKSID